MSVISHRVGYVLARIKEQYNPEHDVPADPVIPWYTACLLEAIEGLAEVADKQAEQFKALEARLEALERPTQVCETCGGFGNHMVGCPEDWSRLDRHGDHVTLHLDFWDCECKEHYIWHKSHNVCVACGARQEERPNSRADEVWDMFEKEGKGKQGFVSRLRQSLERDGLLQPQLQDKPGLTISYHIGADDLEGVIDELADADETVTPEMIKEWFTRVLDDLVQEPYYYGFGDHRIIGKYLPSIIEKGNKSDASNQD